MCCGEPGSGDVVNGQMAPVPFRAKFGDILPLGSDRHVVQIVMDGEVVGMLTADTPEMRDQIKQAGDAVGSMTLHPAAADEPLAVWERGDMRLVWMVQT